MAGRRCLTFNLFLPAPCTHALPPSFVISASHLPPTSAIPIVDIPHITDPPAGSLEPSVRALALTCGTVQTVLGKEGLGKDTKIEEASHGVQRGVSHNPSPDIIYIYIVYFFNVVI